MTKKKTNLYSLRIEARLSQAELARLAGIDRQTISNAENGRNVAELSLAKIAHALSSSLARVVKASDILLQDAA